MCLNYWATCIYIKSYGIHANYADHFFFLTWLFITDLLWIEPLYVVKRIWVSPPWLGDKPSGSPLFLWPKQKYLNKHENNHNYACHDIRLYFHEIFWAHFYVKRKKRLTSKKTHYKLSVWTLFRTFYIIFYDLRNP